MQKALQLQGLGGSATDNHGREALKADVIGSVISLVELESLRQAEVFSKTIRRQVRSAQLKTVRELDQVNDAQSVMSHDGAARQTLQVELVEDAMADFLDALPIVRQAATHPVRNGNAVSVLDVL